MVRVNTTTLRRVAVASTRTRKKKDDCTIANVERCQNICPSNITRGKKTNGLCVTSSLYVINPSRKGNNNTIRQVGGEASDLAAGHSADSRRSEDRGRSSGMLVRPH